jgi:replicative DNA helicase
MMKSNTQHIQAKGNQPKNGTQEPPDDRFLTDLATQVEGLNVSGVDKLLERGLISDLMIDPMLFGKVGHLLKASMFQVIAHRVLFSVIAQKYNADQVFDAQNVLTGARAYFQNISNHKYFSELEKQEAEYYLNEANLDDLVLFLLNKPNDPDEEALIQKANEIRENWMAKKLLVDYSKAIRSIRNKRNIHGVIVKLRADLDEITSVSNNSETDIKEIGPEFLKEVHHLMHNPKNSNKFKSGFKELDKKAPLKKTKLHVIGARPAMGKTSMMLTHALAAAKSGTPVRIYSLEMSKFELVARFCQYLNGIPAAKISDGDLTEGSFKLVQQVIAALEELDIKIDDDTYTIEEISRQLRNEDFSDGLILADYIQIAKTLEKQLSKDLRIENVARDSKIIAKRHNSCFVWLSQLTKEVESRKDKRPLVSDLWYGSALEQAADVVRMLYRDDFYMNQKDRMEKPHLLGTGEDILRKNRGGGLSTIDLEFKDGMWISDYLDDLYQLNLQPIPQLEISSELENGEQEDLPF